MGVWLLQRERVFDTVLLLQNKNKTKVSRSSVAASKNKFKNGAERHFHASLKVPNIKPLLLF